MNTPMGADQRSITPSRDGFRSDAETSPDMPTDAVTSSSATEADPVIALAEEKVHIDKRIVEGNRVRVSTRTDIMEQVLRETLRGDAVGVTRVPVDRVIAEGELAPQVRTEAGVTIIPVMEEVLVVEKRLVLREEIHIRQTSSGEDVEVPVTLRKQHAVVEHLGSDGQPLQPHETTISEETTR